MNESSYKRKLRASKTTAPMYPASISATRKQVRILAPFISLQTMMPHREATSGLTLFSATVMPKPATGPSKKKKTKIGHDSTGEMDVTSKVK